MPDILIRMEMPKNCFQCLLSVLNGERLFCKVTKEEVLRAKLAPECPIVELPQHGDLIDRDALLNRIDAYVCGSMDCVFIKNEIIKAMPVIVPAERRIT